MLRTRVMTSIVGVAVIATIVMTDSIVLGVGVFIVALVGMHEFYKAVSNVGFNPIKSVGYIACIPILFIGLNGVIKKVDNYIELFKSVNYFSMWIFAVILVLFCFIIFQHNKYNINDISLTLFGVMYVAFLFSFIVLTRNLQDGVFFIWLIFIGAWSTDTFAYFTGRLIGKHKLLPAISPKKTVEGAIGGIFGCVAVTVLYGIFINRVILHVPLFHYVVIGFLNGIISQIGDWAASAIKRYVNIKDYSNTLPGHGGILDRFDSMLFIAPVVYFYINFIILK